MSSQDKPAFSLLATFEDIIKDDPTLDPAYIPPLDQSKHLSKNQVRKNFKLLLEQYGDEIFKMGLPVPQFIIDEDTDRIKSINSSYKTTQELKDMKFYSDPNISAEEKQELYKRRLREQLEKKRKEKQKLLNIS